MARFPSSRPRSRGAAPNTRSEVIRDGGALADGHGAATVVHGVALVARGLVELANRASFCVALGTIGLGTSMRALDVHPTEGRLVVCIGIFFALAKAGQIIDGMVKRR